MTVASFGDHKPFIWNRQHMLSVLTSGKTPIVTSQELANAFSIIDRADFLPLELKSRAYEDIELDFAMGQQTNSPVIVAQMLSSLNLQPGQKVLELGSGAGYSAAVISATIGNAGRLYTIERNQQVYEIAKSNLAKYPQLQNYELVFMDGAKGLPARAPYDAIHVSFAYENIPHELLVQLKVGGKLVMPLTNLEIKIYTRIDEGSVKEELLTARKFSKMQSGVE